MLLLLQLLFHSVVLVVNLAVGVALAIIGVIVDSACVIVIVVDIVVFFVIVTVGSWIIVGSYCYCNIFVNFSLILLLTMLLIFLP